MLAKSFNEIAADDIRDLCARGAYENQLLEYRGKRVQVRCNQDETL
jgi:hypothetical protein